MSVDRRTLLAALAAGASGTAGCLGAIPGVGEGKQPILVRAMRARGDETEYRCRIDDSLVGAYPALERALARARDRPVGEWARTDVSRERGNEIVHALESHCEVSGGIYVYDGETFWISLVPRKITEGAGHHHGTGHGNGSGHDHDHDHDHGTTDRS